MKFLPWFWVLPQEIPQLSPMFWLVLALTFWMLVLLSGIKLHFTNE